jgi:tRNA threonylcarbamoyladenosine biosynthesis protein TsaB
MIICLESATPTCSVALCNKGNLVSLKESEQGRSHATLLTVFIQELLKEAGLKTTDLDAVAVSKGPGSYTGLRIGVSVAKGIAYGASIPLIGVETTFSLYSGYISQQQGFKESDLFCPLIDARRMEVYYSLYDINGTTVKSIRAEIMDKKSFSDIPVTSRIFFFGDGTEKCSKVIKRENVVFDEDFKISASYMAKPVYETFKAGHFEDVAYFEPFYLKDFIATKPVKNITGKILAR